MRMPTENTQSLIDESAQPVEMITVLDATAVQALLAHRHPFLLVDRITIIDPGQHVVGTKRITTGEWWNEGDNVGLRAFPHALVLEALAQTSGALVRDLTDGAEGAIAYFVGLDHVRLRELARPGDTLRMELRMLKWRRGICRTRGIATVNGRFIASAALTTIVRGAA